MKQENFMNNPENTDRQKQSNTPVSDTERIAVELDIMKNELNSIQRMLEKFIHDLPTYFNIR